MNLNLNKAQQKMLNDSLIDVITSFLNDSDVLADLVDSIVDTKQIEIARMVDETIKQNIDEITVAVIKKRLV